MKQKGCPFCCFFLYNHISSQAIGHGQRLSQLPKLFIKSYFVQIRNWESMKIREFDFSKMHLPLQCQSSSFMCKVCHFNQALKVTVLVLCEWATKVQVHGPDLTPALCQSPHWGHRLPVPSHRHLLMIPGKPVLSQTLAGPSRLGITFLCIK